MDDKIKYQLLNFPDTNTGFTDEMGKSGEKVKQNYHMLQMKHILC